MFGISLIGMKIIGGNLPVIAVRAVPGAGRQNIPVRHNLNKGGEVRPRLRLKEFLDGNAGKKSLYLPNAVLDGDLPRDLETPQIHQSVDRWVHRQEIGID